MTDQIDVDIDVESVVIVLAGIKCQLAYLNLNMEKLLECLQNSTKCTPSSPAE